MLRKASISLCLAAVVISRASISYAQETYELVIPAQAVADAVKSLSYQTQHSVLFQTDVLGDAKTASIRGNFSLQQALDRLLLGTNLQGGLTESGVIVISLRHDAGASGLEGTTVVNKDIKRSLLAGVAAISIGGGVAHSQEQATETVQTQVPEQEEAALINDTIIVTGRRQDAELSIAAKRDAKQVVDVLSADQASRLPDNNIAESLGRIPGVSFQRNGETGNGDFIAIRGLDSALNNVQFNGVNSGLAQYGGRRVPLDGISAADIAEIRVAKSLLPQDEGEGIGGAINISQKTPLLRGEDAYTFDIAARPSEFAGKTGYKVAGSVTKVWGDTFGVNFAASFRKRYVDNFLMDSSSTNISVLPEIRDVNGDIVSPQEILDLGLEDAGSAFDDVFAGLIPDSAMTFEQQSYEFQTSERDTLTLSGAIDWRPVDHTLLTLGGRYSRRDSDALEFKIAFDEDDRDFELINGQLVTEFNDPEIDVNAQVEDQLDINSSFFLRGKTELERTTIDYQVSYARAVTREPQTDLAFNTGSLLDADTVTFQPYTFVDTYFPVPNLDALNDPDFANAITDFAGTQELSWFETDLIDDRENDRYAARFDIERDLGWDFDGGSINSVRVGAKFERSDIREDWIELVDDAGDLNLDGTYNIDGNGTAEDALLSAFPGLYGGLESLDNIGSPLSSLGLSGIPRMNENALRSLDETFRRSFLASGADPSGTYFFDAREEVLAGYVQADAEFGNLSVVAGVRVEHYEGEYSSPLFLNANLRTWNSGVSEVIDLEQTGLLDTFTTTSSNTEVLPRLNAVYEVNDKMQVRGGIGMSIARPTFYQLGAATDVYISLEGDADYLGAGPILEGISTAADAVAAGGINLDQISWASIYMESGNPDLENAQSLNFDLSFEYYPVKGTALTAGLFAKDIDNFIFVGAESSSGVVDIDFAESLLSADGRALLSGATSLQNIIDSGVDGELEVLIPQNGEKAEVRGIELGLIHQFDWAPGFLSDFGMFANVTLTDTEATIPLVEAATIANPDGGLQDDDALVGLGYAEVGDGVYRKTSFFNSPDLTSNASIYYEANGIEAALSASYQSEQFDAVDDFGLDQYVGDYFQLDLFLGYTLPWEEFGMYEVYFEVADLTDTGQKVTDLNTVGRQRNVFDEGAFNGREFVFGLRGRF